MLAFRKLRCGLVIGLLLTAAACSTRHIDPPEVQGPLAMVEDAGGLRLWMLSKREEVRTVGVAGGSRRTVQWRDDTFFHFDLHAFDPVNARPLWRRRLLTLGDPEAAGATPSRVIGSAAEGRLLGQDGRIVWLLVDNAPMAVSAVDGTIVADATGIERRNPALKGLLPRDAKHYGFDRGLVLMRADARRFVLRGPNLDAAAYAPTAPPAPEPERMANGHERIVPMRPPFGDVPIRQIMLAGEWLGLYTPKEAADALNDNFGDRYRYPYTILDEGALARRSFWRGRVVDAQRFDDRFKRLADLAPIADGPTFLRGRFVADADAGTDKALLLHNPSGALVWHSTRIDSDGRLALTRIDARLRTLWTAELPLGEAGTINPVRHWRLPGRLVVAGMLQSQVDGITRREPHMVSIDLASGAWQGWNFERETAVR